MSGLRFEKGRTVKGRGLSLAARLQAARRVPQAVMKVISYGHGTKGVSQSIDYISRKGELELETELGDVVLGRKEQKELVENWSRDFDTRKRCRNSIHLAFSMPKGSDPEKLRAAVRKVITEHFAGHEAVFAIHEDRPHPHAHVIMKTRNRKTGKKLRLGISEIFEARTAFAEAACEQGVELAASPRAARGVGKKAISQAIHHMKQRGVQPRANREAADEIISEFKRGAANSEKPWEKAMRERNEKERSAYREEAERLRLAADQERFAQDQVTRTHIRQAAADLKRYAEEMPEPKTRRQSFLEKLAKHFGISQSNRNRSSRTEMER